MKRPEKERRYQYDNVELGHAARLMLSAIFGMVAGMALLAITRDGASTNTIISLLAMALGFGLTVGIEARIMSAGRD